MWRVEAYEDANLVEAFDGYETREAAEDAIRVLEAEDDWIGYGYVYALVPPSDSWIKSFERVDEFTYLRGDTEYDEL